MKLSGFNFVGLLLGILSIAFWIMLASSPNVAETIFSREIYPLIASPLAFIGAVIPFAVTTLVFIFASLALIYFLARPFLGKTVDENPGLKEKCLRSAIDFLSFGGVLLFFTCASFLYNHHRFSEEKLFNLSFDLDQTQYQQLVRQSVKEANALSSQFALNERGCTDINFDLREFDALIEKDQSNFLETHGLPAVAFAETKYFTFSKLWSGMSIAGQYQPLFGQPNITRERPDYSKPLTIAHERGHLNGFASEAGANLVAFQTLLHSRDARLQYLVRLELWRRNVPEGINEQVQKDLQCWQEDFDQVERFEFDFISRKINDFYLKASGHKDGVKSYGRGRHLALKYYYQYFVVDKPVDGEINS